jgi:VIT1/CCC1 family predicted Fe2+/Mn2+ transporter
LKAAAVTFGAFFLMGAIPLIAFLVQLLRPSADFHPFTLSAAATAVSFFAVGAIKARFVDRTWYRGGIETLLVGGAASALAYIVGTALQRLAS